jgi:hypothetical protein
MGSGASSQSAVTSNLAPGEGLPTTAAANHALSDTFAEIEQIGDETQRGHARSLVDSVQHQINPQDIFQAIKHLKESLPTPHGDAIIVTFAAQLQAVAHLAPDVVSNVSIVMISIAAHLPYIGVAAAAIAGIIQTFKLSKDQDENIQTVSLWMASINDWLMLIANRVDRSRVSSTLPLFEGLQDALVGLSTRIETQSGKWRLSKMLTSISFENDFNRAKSAVLELKAGLRDLLDEESKRKQEEQLVNLTSLHLDLTDKMSSINDELAQIRTLLQNQTSASSDSASHVSVATPTSQSLWTLNQNWTEEENVFEYLKATCGGRTEQTPSDSIPISHFITVCEITFLEGKDMPSEQRRGLKISLDREGTGFVSKIAFIKFYRQWLHSQLSIQEYLNKIAEENASLLQKGQIIRQAVGQKAAQLITGAISTGRQSLQQKGIENFDDARALMKQKAKNFLGGGGGKEDAIINK